MSIPITEQPYRYTSEHYTIDGSQQGSIAFFSWVIWRTRSQPILWVTIIVQICVASGVNWQVSPHHLSENPSQLPAALEVTI
jgi:hypothetical protein